MSAKAKAGWCLLGLALGGFLGAKGAANLAQARAQMFALRDGQEQQLIRQLEGQRALLLARFQQVTVLYEPCGLTVARGLATIEPGPTLAAAGAPECAAWVIPAEVEPRRWGAAPGGLVMHADRQGAPHGGSAIALRMPGFDALGPVNRPAAPVLQSAIVDGGPR
jgi:hypothetical protein